MKVTTSEDTRISRCAVCKIDLKGRFVFVDENIQSLLGYTLEELFARPINDFMADEDHEVINQILSQSNRYESFFKTTRIQLKNKSGEKIPVWIIVSLSFAAGNPVNYQILVKTETGNVPSSPVEPPSADYEQFMSSLACLEGSPNLIDLLKPLQAFVGEEPILSYGVSGNQLTLLSGDENIAGTVPETTALHERIALSGEEYCFTDQDAVQLAIECEGVAPNEFVAPLKADGGRDYLLRLIFPEDTDADMVRKAVSRAKLGIRFLKRFCGSEKNSDAQSSQVQCSVTDTLSSTMSKLGVAVVITNTDGAIVTANAAAQQLMSSGYWDGSETSVDTHIEGRHYRNLIVGLSDCNNAEAIKTIESYCEVATRKHTGSRFDRNIFLPSGQGARLLIGRASDGTDDTALCFAIIPYPARVGGLSEAMLGNALMHSLLDEVDSSISSAVDYSNKLGHENSNKLDSATNFHLLCLKDSLGKASTVISTYGDMLSVAEKRFEPEETDLNIIVNELHQALSMAHPLMAFNIQYGSLPSISSHRETLRAALQTLVTAVLPLVPDQTVNAAVSAGVNNGKCELSINCNVAASREFVGKLNRFFAGNTYGGKNESVTGLAEMHLARLMIERLKGSVGFRLSKKDGMEIELTIPTVSGKKRRPKRKSKTAPVG